MAKLEMEIADDVLKDISFIESHATTIFGGMTKAGAEYVREQVVAGMPEGMKRAGLASAVKVTRTYRTPSDDGINNKVVMGGYFTNRNGKKTPIPLVANLFEYGSSSGKYPKKPFFRKAFRKKSQIEAIMKAKQKELSGGLLDDE